MKQILLIAILAVLAGIIPVATQANTVVRTGENISISENQSVTGDFYAVGRSITVSGEVTGDAYVAGAIVTINGVVGEDIAITGGTVSLHASATEDVRIIAGDVTIAEDVAGDVVIVAGRAHILSTATVSGNVLLFGGDVTIEGEVTGDVLGTVDRLRIDGTVGGVDVAAHDLVLGEQAVVEKNITYESANEITRAQAAVVNGDINRTDVPMYADSTTTSSRILIVSCFVSLFATIVMSLIARRLMVAIADRVFDRPDLQLLYGLGTILIVPFAIATFLVSVLGSLFGVTLLMFWLFMALVTVPAMNIVLGVYIAKYTAGYQDGTLPLLHSFAAAMVLFGMLLVPVVGSLFFMVVFFATIGLLMRLVVEILYR